MVIHNPYHNISGIDNEEMFFGRIGNKERILSEVLEASQCISIVGQRKIGKTSLIQSLARPVTLKNLDFVDFNVLFVYINCQMYQYAQKSVEAFYELLVTHLHKEIKRKLGETDGKLLLATAGDNNWQRTWERTLEGLIEHDIHVVVTLDEFDRVILQEHLIKDGLFGSLRAYGQWPKFSWITSTHRPLHVLFNGAFDGFKMPKNIRQAESDFYNIFGGDHSVGLFPANDIQDLIEIPARRHGQAFSETDIEFILSFGGRFAYFIQRACYHTFRARQQGAVDHYAIVQQCLREARPLWDQYWNNLHTGQQEILLALAKRSNFDTPFREFANESRELERLQDDALTYCENGKWYPFSDEFADFIRSKEKPHIETDVQIGSLLHHYEIVQIIGRTGHSQVVKAWDTQLERYVAIKRVYSDKQLSTKISEERNRRLKREGKIISEILKNVEHKNIGKIYSAIADPTTIIMPWIDGLSLEQLLDEDTPLQIQQVLSIGIDITSALVHIHKQGVIHRDIKPNNIIWSKDGAILFDFDIARSINTDTITLLEDGTHSYVGNERYSGPEQLIAPDSVGPGADIFSLGVVLYQLLTHTMPFLWGGNPGHYGGRLPRPAQGTIPQSLYDLFCEMMNQDPTYRLTAEQAQTRLQHYLDSIKEGI